MVGADSGTCAEESCIDMDHEKLSKPDQFVLDVFVGTFSTAEENLLENHKGTEGYQTDIGWMGKGISGLVQEYDFLLLNKKSSVKGGEGLLEDLLSSRVV